MAVARKIPRQGCGQNSKRKGRLIRSLRPQGRAPRYRDYRESDAPMIARIVRELGIAGEPAAKSASYERFRERVKECCERLGA